MSTGIFAIVLLAAALHATWNALVKGGADKTAAMAAVVLGQGGTGLLILPFVPSPDAASLPYLALGIALHLGYQLFLIAAYRIGDLTQVYPIARGVAPLLVACISALFLGVTFSAPQVGGIAMVALGIASMSLVRRSDGGLQGKAALLALITGGFIASYSLVDGIGARLAGTALGFYCWMSFLNAVGFAAIARVMRPGLIRRSLALRTSLIVGGSASYGAYALVIYAFTQAPIALVTALRETSIIFALMLGICFLGEKLTPAKVVATVATVAGVVILRMASG